MVKKKKLLILSVATMLALTGCKSYKNFKEEAKYVVDENGSVTMTGFIDKEYLDKIYFIHLKNNENIVYMVYVKSEFNYNKLYDIKTNFHFGDLYKNDTYKEITMSLHQFIVESGYELKDKYTEEDIDKIFDLYKEKYITTEEEKQLELENESE